MVQPETLENTIFAYTSDHGQTLSENGETWPQTGPTHNEANVPLLIVSAPAFNNRYRLQGRPPKSVCHLAGFDAGTGIKPHFLTPLRCYKRLLTARSRVFYIVGDITSALRSAVYGYDDEVGDP